MVKKALSLLSLLLISLPVLAACNANANSGGLNVGYSGGYLSAALYAAQDDLPEGTSLQQFHSTSDIAYSLLSGALDAGFVEAEKLAALSELEGFDRLSAVGKVTYPYGATLVLREGLNVRLNELNGLTIAASAPGCVLLDAFAVDAKRFGADISDVRYEYMPFDAMVPALEAGEADAAIIKGAYAVIALQEGHSILYQNWEVQPGDECCPAIVDQAILILLARRDKLDAAVPFADALADAQAALTADELRRAVADNTVIPFEILQGQPVPEFSLADDELLAIFIAAANDDDDDDDDGNGGDAAE